MKISKSIQKKHSNQKTFHGSVTFNNIKSIVTYILSIINKKI